MVLSVMITTVSICQSDEKEKEKKTITKTRTIIDKDKFTELTVFNNFFDDEFDPLNRFSFGCNESSESFDNERVCC